MSGTATHRPSGRPGTVGWEVRAARSEDAAAIAAGVATLLAELGGTPPARAALEAEACAHIADPSLGIVLVAAAEAELIGVLAASWARAIQLPGRKLTIEVLWTRRGWRDRGVGAALVEAVAAAAADAGTGRIEVGLPREAFAALRATERFYLANGFERLGPRMRRSFSAGAEPAEPGSARATS